ncbi:hypothetical protein EfmAA818_15480 [Enterococcus faecium]|nr:hypothetical protein EfmAA818_15480 [Enterococcus faecium]
MTTVIRTLKEFKSYLPKQSKKILPRVLMVDEFRSHASIEDKMSFICAAQSYFVQPRHSIANHVRYKIASLLTEKVSLSFIAKSCQVSLTTVIRTLKEFKSYLPKQSKKILPRVLMVDEFRSHASIEDKMSFICADGETGKLIDVLPTRKLPRLTSYFLGCTNPEEVEFLVTDMNAAYFQLTKRVLPNAKVVIDRFHIVKHMNQAFTKTLTYFSPYWQNFPKR